MPRGLGLVSQPHALMATRPPNQLSPVLLQRVLRLCRSARIGSITDFEATLGGALVRDHHAAGDQAGQLLQRQGADRQDGAVCGGLQQDQDPVQLVRHSGLNPGEAPETLRANLRDDTLEARLINQKHRQSTYP
jgi:hypothetical protein